MMNRCNDGVRLTHLPTGVVAMSRGCAPRRRYPPRWHTVWARRLLLAKLCRPAGGDPVRRTYDLCPPLGIEPNIRQGTGTGAWLVTGIEAVNAVLRGETLDQLLIPLHKGD